MNDLYKYKYQIHNFYSISSNNLFLSNLNQKLIIFKNVFLKNPYIWYFVKLKTTSIIALDNFVGFYFESPSISKSRNYLFTAPNIFSKHLN